MNSTNRKLLSQYLLGNQAGNLGSSFVLNSSAFDNVNDVSVANSATVSRNTTTPLTKESDFAIALPNNTNGSVTWTLATLDRGLSGGNCLFSFVYTASSMGSNVVAQVLQGASVVATSQVLGASTTPVQVQLNAPCGDLSSSTTVRIANTTGNTGTSALRVANVTYGNATNLTNVSQAQMFGLVKISGCASFWNTTSTSFASFGPEAGCSYAVEGNAQAPATNVPAMTFASLPAGEYFLTYDGNFGQSNAGSYACLYEVYDGTNEWRERVTVESALTGPDAFRGSTFTSSFKYDTAQSNITLQIRARTTNGALGCGIYGSTGGPGVLKLYRFPTSSQQAVSVDNTAASWSGTATLSGSTSSASFADPTGITGAVTTTNSTGVSCVINGSSLLGIDCTVPKIGSYLVCYTGTMVATLNSPTSRLVDGSGNVIVGAQSGDGGGGATQVTSGGCGTTNITSLSSVSTFKVQSSSNGGTTTVKATSFSIVGINQQFPAPLLVGSVTSNSAGLERIERATIAEGGVCSSSPCTINRQSGSWLTSVTRAAAGEYQLNIAAGIFSTPPTCTCISAQAGCISNDVPTTTVYKFFTQNSVAVPADGEKINVLCMGQR